MPECKIYVKIHLKKSERKVVWQMQSVKKHKWILFLLIGFMIISFFQFLPQTDTLHLEKTSQSLKLAADILPDGRIEQYQTDWLMEPGIAEHQA